MKAFTKDEYQLISKNLDYMFADIAEQESDFIKRSAVRAILDEIKTDVYDAEVYDFPMLIIDAQLHVLTMLYTGINKYRGKISDEIWNAFFRHTRDGK